MATRKRKLSTTRERPTTTIPTARFGVRTERCADGSVWVIVTDPRRQDAPLQPEAGRDFCYTLAGLWSKVTHNTAVRIEAEHAATLTEPALLTARQGSAVARTLVTPLAAYGWGVGFGRVPSTQPGEDDEDPFASTLVVAHHQRALSLAVSALVQNTQPTDPDGMCAADDLWQVLQLLPGVYSLTDRIVWCMARLFPSGARLALLRHLSAPLEARPGSVPSPSGDRTPARTRIGNTVVDVELTVLRRIASRDDPPPPLADAGFGPVAVDFIIDQVANFTWRRLDEPLWDSTRPPLPPGPYDVLRLDARIENEPAHGPAVTDTVLRALAERLLQRCDVGGVLRDPDGRAAHSALDGIACVGFLAVRFFLQNIACASLATLPVGVWAAMLGQPYPAVADAEARRTDGRVPDAETAAALRVGARWAFGPCGKWACRVVSPTEIKEALTGERAVPTLDDLRRWVLDPDSKAAKVLFAALEYAVRHDENAGRDVLAAALELWTGAEGGRLPVGGMEALRPRGTVSTGPNFVAHQCAHQIDVPTTWLEPEPLPPEETGPLLRAALFHCPTNFGFA